MNNYIPLSECKSQWVYKIDSRNLLFGVFNSIDNGFIGIREKFDQLYLFTEYHYQYEGPFPTAYPVQDLEEVPADLIITEHFGVKDQITDRLVKFDRPISEGGKGWYFIDSGESNKEIRPVGVSNRKLFDYLLDIENRYSV